MKDRQARNPGRVYIRPENGQPGFYAVMEMADNPTEEGTPINTATMLTDSTADTLGLASTRRTPNEAFLRLKNDSSQQHQQAMAAANNAQRSANNAQNTANAAMPRSGGYFTGVVQAATFPRQIRYNDGELVNVSIRTAGQGSAATANLLVFERL